MLSVRKIEAVPTGVNDRPRLPVRIIGASSVVAGGARCVRPWGVLLITFFFLFFGQSAGRCERVSRGKCNHDVPSSLRHRCRRIGTCSEGRKNLESSE